MSRRAIVSAAGLLGALGVAAGAFGAHALRETLDPAAAAVWQTAARYHLVHAVAALAAGLGPAALWRGPWARCGATAWRCTAD